MAQFSEHVLKHLFLLLFNSLVLALLLSMFAELVMFAVKILAYPFCVWVIHISEILFFVSSPFFALRLIKIKLRLLRFFSHWLLDFWVFSGIVVRPFLSSAPFQSFDLSEHKREQIQPR